MLQQRHQLFQKIAYANQKTKQKRNEHAKFVPFCISSFGKFFHAESGFVRFNFPSVLALQPCVPRRAAFVCKLNGLPIKCGKGWLHKFCIRCGFSSRQSAATKVRPDSVPPVCSMQHAPAACLFRQSAPFCRDWCRSTYRSLPF